MPSSPESLLALLAERARISPDAPALIEPGGRTITYLELCRRVFSVVRDFDELGVQRQDRIVVPAVNDIDGAVLLLATISTAVCFPVNTMLAQDEFEAVFDIVQPSAIAQLGSGAAKLSRAAASRQLHTLHVSADPDRCGLLTVEGGNLDPYRVLPQPLADESLLLRTSGTTSVGKIVPLAISQILAGGAASARAYRLGDADRCLNVMPLFHIQGLVGSIVATLLSGGSVILLPAFEAGEALRCIERQRATWFSASPTIHRLLLDAQRAESEPFDTSSLRFTRSGAAALPAALRKELEAAYGIPILETYGMSEAHQIASTLLPPTPNAVDTTPADMTPADTTPAGMTPTGSRVGVLDAHGRVATEPGARGELVVSGDNVIERYFWPQDASAAFVDGWLRTGDLGTLAGDGSVVITGRIKEMINRGGEKVSPYEVEDVLLRHPAVREAVAFGVADDVLTEKLASAVVLHPGAAATEDELRRHAAEHLAPFKVPGRVLIQGELPTNAVGKLVRADFSRLLTEQLAAQGEEGAQTAPGDPLARPAAAPPQHPGTPRNPMQAAIAGLWAFALGKASLGIDEDFFTAGGESLSAVALLRSVKETFGVEISPVDLFDDLNTVERMSEAVRVAVGAGAAL